MFSRVLFLIIFECSNVKIMATLKFVLQSKSDNAPIYLRLSVKRGKIIYRKTGLFVSPKNWSSTTGLPKQNNTANKNLTSQLRKLNTYVLDNLNNANTINGDWLLHHIDVFFNRKNEDNKSQFVVDAIDLIINTAHTRDNGKGGIGLSECRVNAYKRLKDLFSEFQGRKNFLVKELNQSQFDKFRVWLLDEKKYSHSYGLKKLADLKTVCKDARKNGIETSDQLTDIKTKQVSAYDDDMDVITLTLSELEKIEKATLLNESLINARKWLMLACYTGQRGKALTTRIKERNFEKYGNDYIIKIKQKKGNKPVLIPVLPKVKEIYENGLPYEISLQKLNKYFKKIGEIAEINEPTLGRIQGKEKRGIKEVRPKFKYISTHIGRRSFASNHYGKIPTPIIMRVTGHAKESTFLQYINQSDNSHIDTFLDYYKAKEKQENGAKLKVLTNKAM